MEEDLLSLLFFIADWWLVVLFCWEQHRIYDCCSSRLVHRCWSVQIITANSSVSTLTNECRVSRKDGSCILEVEEHNMKHGHPCHILPKRGGGGGGGGEGGEDRKMVSTKQIMLDLCGPKLCGNALLELSKVVSSSPLLPRKTPRSPSRKFRVCSYLEDA
ncbi:uncharacterized protein [Triticum aestivum]|uniref:uncharacterized protein n=1 Tax=Triticum aestivum TaxID=4565 RepID=UPI001D024103|nr:uncharacterized protein LOC123112671 [Triticum aestivum]XP_044389665.1 uncharacterized protein LOC123112671 [Triticum aestivum]